jgi:hypothetical protein
VKKNFLFVLLPLILCPLLILPAFGRRERENIPVQEENRIELQIIPARSALEQDTEPQSAAVQASGRVRLVGTSLFPELVISGPDREWYIDREEVYKLADLQQRQVTVEGTETVTELTWANGRSAGERRTLRDIVIIDVE